MSELEGWISASIRRWERLVTEEVRTVDQSPYKHGYWTASYLVASQASDDLTLSDLLELLERTKGHETGWPPWWVPTRTAIAPYPYRDSIECWLLRDDISNDPGHADFWRASLPPRLFLLRGYQEDSPLEPVQWERGTMFDLTLPVWRVGEVLLHASRLAASLDTPAATIIALFGWTGLKNRRLASWANPHRHLSGDQVCHQSELRSNVASAANEIPDRLPELVQAVTRPLYELFDFFAPPPEMFQEELARMRSRRL